MAMRWRRTQRRKVLMAMTVFRAAVLTIGVDDAIKGGLVDVGGELPAKVPCPARDHLLDVVGVEGPLAVSSAQSLDVEGSDLGQGGGLDGVVAIGRQIRTLGAMVTERQGCTGRNSSTIASAFWSASLSIQYPSCTKATAMGATCGMKPDRFAASSTPSVPVKGWPRRWR